MRRFSLASVVLGVIGLSGLALGETPPANCAGSETYRFTLQGSNNDGYTWSGGMVQLYALPSTSLYVRVRTLMTVTSGQTQGWSFGVQHTNPWTQYYGGAVSINSVTTSGSGTATVQNGSPPDTNHLQIRSGFNGFTQGVSIDNDTGITLGPVTDFVTAKACFLLTAPSYEGTYPIDIKFSHDIGNPPIDATVVQTGFSNTVCVNNLQLVLNVSSSTYPTPQGTCNYYGAGMSQGGSDEPGKGQDGGPELLAPLPAGAPGTDFKRGDANNDGSFNISDPLFILSFLFSGGPPPSCDDAADANDDERRNIADAIFSLQSLFIGGTPPPPPPFPGCGPDLTDTTTLTLRCDTYTHCNQEDSDCDGLSNSFENIIGTDAGEITLPCSDPENIAARDTDRDFFPDGHEVLPVGIVCSEGGGSTNLRFLGANPLTRDIFLEIDPSRCNAFYHVALVHNVESHNGLAAYPGTWILLEN